MKLRSIIVPILIISALTTILGSGQPKVKPIGERSISLEKRYAVPSVNEVMKDNILLNLYYLRGQTKPNANVDWSKVRENFTYELKLEPGQSFAYHDSVLPEYKNSLVKTTNSHFNSYEGFKSDGYLVGDGVCHLASLIYWAARDAGLDTKAPVNHDFAIISEIPREYGVSIYSPQEDQNLYIRNDFDSLITIKFEYDGENLKVSVLKDSSALNQL